MTLLFHSPNGKSPGNNFLVLLAVIQMKDGLTHIVNGLEGNASFPLRNLCVLRATPEI